MARHRPYWYLLIIFIQFLNLEVNAQSLCPPNIGFESGTFANWTAAVGNVTTMPNQNTQPSPMASTNPVDGRHSMIVNTSPQVMDYYGNFPMNAPNGSGYSVKLGNEVRGAETEMLTYTFTVPANVSEYTLVYNYAVVFEDPADHSFSEKPKFSAKVFNVTKGGYIECGSFEYTSSSNLPGFVRSPIPGSAVGNQTTPVYYKPWSSVSINLSNLGGDVLRLEFLTQDCTRNGHFGYAYVDVVEACESPITGNVYCLNNSSMTLRAPVGYQSYYWYNANDLNTVIGTEDRLILSPPPPDGTRYAVRLVPYPGFGCEDIIYTTVKGIGEYLDLRVVPSVTACFSQGVNLKDPILTKGSSPNLAFSYFKDPAATIFVDNPEKVIESGTYYIKARNVYGCEEIKQMDITILPSPTLTIRPPNPVCLPQTIDLTNPSITAGSSPDAALSYWRDAAATQSLTNPGSISVSGTYYIKATLPNGCSVINSVSLIIMPQVVADAPDALGCAPFDLTDPALVNSNVSMPILTYWLDAGATQPVADPTRVMTAGTFFIKVANEIGCFAIATINISLYDYPQVDASDPEPVVFPSTVDIQTTYMPKPNHRYSYWRDSLATIRLENPNAIDITGRYFIKIENIAGCYSTQAVRVTILPSVLPDIIAPNTFSPNGDGMNDIFRVAPLGAVSVRDFRVFNRWGEQMYITTEIVTGDWDGKLNGTTLPTGTYYWVYNGTDYFRGQPFRRSGSVTIVK